MSHKIRTVTKKICAHVSRSMLKKNNGWTPGQDLRPSEVPIYLITTRKTQKATTLQ
jgi:hypothetical protein